MALITCPECGKENVSSSAVACPNCGFEIKEYTQKMEAESRAKANLEIKKQAEEEAHQRLMDEMPDPTPYGKLPAYIVIAVVGLFLALVGSPIFILIAAIVAVAYWYRSNTDYKQFLENPDAYKENKAIQMKAKAATGNGVNIAQPNTVSQSGPIFCPRCGSEDVTKQVFQENKGSTTVTETKSKYKERGHGCLWWLLIGWWWWMVDLCLWTFFFFPRLIIRLFAAPFKKKKYKGKSTSVSKTVNDISYRTICTCNKCGNTWG